MNKQEIDIQVRSIIGEKEFEKYKKFALREDMLNLAVGVILGNSFNKVVYGFSDYIIMPILRFFSSKTGESWRVWKFSPIEGLEFEIGSLVGTLTDFLLISILLYIFYTKFFQPIIKEQNKEITTKKCKYCYSTININAIKCPHCTGDLDA